MSAIMQRDDLPAGTEFYVAGESYIIANTLSGGVWRRIAGQQWEECGIEEANNARRELAEHQRRAERHSRRRT